MLTGNGWFSNFHFTWRASAVFEKLAPHGSCTYMVLVTLPLHFFPESVFLAFFLQGASCRVPSMYGHGFPVSQFCTYIFILK